MLFFNLLIIAQNPYSLANIGSIYAITRVVQSHACLFILNVVQHAVEKTCKFERILYDEHKNFKSKKPKIKGRF